MSMYLPNPDLQPTGSEPGEFIEETDPWTARADSQAPPSSTGCPHPPGPAQPPPAGPLTDQTGVNTANSP